jgi:CheY-like chemotaxis protein
VIATESAAAALSAFEHSLSGRHFDLLLTDIEMPDRDGFQLLADVRDLERRHGRPVAIPAVALTAHARDNERARARAAGFTAFVSKPVDPQRLIDSITNVQNAN